MIAFPPAAALSSVVLALLLRPTHRQKSRWVLGFLAMTMLSAGWVLFHDHARNTSGFAWLPAPEFAVAWGAIALAGQLFYLIYLLLALSEATRLRWAILISVLLWTAASLMIWLLAGFALMSH
ncbi:hypothetical protein [Shimia sp.]|uniref:hypothetical protein n=1 Tax=Shimia sp. TaxID=1954381 RepID=UPI003B8D9B71